MSENFIIGAIITAIVGIPTGLLMGLAFWLAAATCSSQASKMELQHSWGPLQDCMIHVDGKWMLLDSYKVVKLRPAQ